MFEDKDIIWHTRWKELVDFDWDGRPDVPPGVIGCDITRIPELFSLIKENGRDYIIVSYNSDFGLNYQKEVPPAADLAKWIEMRLNTEEHGYNSVSCPPRLNLARCNITHKFSIKCYAYTKCTFDEIPKNVKHWFTTNNNVEEDVVTTIPFGVYGIPECLDNIKRIINRENVGRRPAAYANFQFCTLERVKLFGQMSADIGFFKCERDLDHATYMDRLSEVLVTVCPFGNGYDSYRNLEAVYAGSIPIYSFGRPLRYLDDAGGIESMLLSFADVLLSLKRACENRVAVKPDIFRFDYWRRKVEDTRNTFGL